MNLFLRVTIAVVMIALLTWVLLNILASLESTLSTDAFPRLADPNDGDAD
jgi:hypothetical protein